jgi:hypothetical protein
LKSVALAIEGGVAHLTPGPLMGVNASPAPSRVHTHDSGPPWLARPSTYDSFIHNTLPVLTGAQIFNYIMKALYMGCQWMMLPIDSNDEGHREIQHTRN